MGIFLDKILGWLSSDSSPSWARSSLTQMFMLSAGAFVIVASKIAWTTGDMSYMSWAATTFGVSYLTDKASSKGKNGNGQPPAGGVA